MAPSNSNVPTPVPFPQPDSPQQPSTNATANSPTTRRSRTSTNASLSSASTRIRTASIKFMEAAPPPGMWAATGTVASKAPTLQEIRKGSFSTSGWNEESQRYQAQRRSSQSEEAGRDLQRRTSNTQGGAAPESPARPGLRKGTSSSNSLRARGMEPFPAVTEEEMSAYPTQDIPPEEVASKPPSYEGPGKEAMQGAEVTEESEKSMEMPPQPVTRKATYGYRPPPKVPWTTSTAIGLKAFWRWFLTPAGFLITLYCLNVVAWGGMLFLLLCNAAPAMCHPDCNDLQSPRRIWIEIDSQILNALFCVTGFGLAPWRFRDLYWWGWWRIGGPKRKQTGIRRLAGIHRGWFRLPGSDHLPEDASAAIVNPEDPAIPIPHAKIPDPPPTGIHAPPTKSWKMDFVIWMNVWNTFFQIALCFYMWHYNRYDRPSWATGLFVALACIVAGLGGIMMFHEGKYVKKVEGVPMPAGYQDGPSDLETQSSNREQITTVPGEAAKSS
ncbi:hypothetical protein BU26DRAFT_437052 [Trematosphaeria pertusa]|uniref:Uncharacterized protein n=1 Tax=Trematosphaeria pertusa TaxID=390896 RepID=A0A6A6HYU3_9PLEO|nr:uncharacterized protein BU26DRAFT_437052 [Trematosphaeria pertusa]KAF2243404.1 hypothetical protein BU26DRAFT_437052 [Trematosphaeria pertusa]